MSDTMEEENVLSQDDIDSLMDPGGDDQQDDGGELSQDDIDSLLGGTANGGAETQLHEAEEEGELSQDDIDRMLGKTPAQDGAVDEEDDESEPISMDDIQRVMASVKKDEHRDGAEPEADPPKDLNSDSVPVSPEEESDREDEFLIEPSQAASLEENLILQETLDALLEGPLEEIAQESVSEAQTQDVEERAEPSDVEGDLPVILEDASDMDPGDITQEDIDSMLKESDGEQEDPMVDEDDILISQDDINDLLMAVEQEGEDLLGDMDKESEPFDFTSSPGSDIETPVVLLKEMESSQGGPAEQKTPGKKPWYTSRLFLAAASVLLFAGIAVPSGYFLFFSDGSDSETAHLQTSSTQEDLARYGADLEIDTDQLSGSSGQLVLKGFIVPVTGTSAELAYVQADVFIDYTDARISDEIHANMAFYRDVVFQAIRQNIREGKEDEVSVAALVWAVETSLKKVLPERFIEKIGFSSFTST